jgi:hypothetical protein
MAEFDDEQVQQIRQIVREERPSMNWGSVTFWIAVVILVLLLVPLVLIYLASQTLMSS